MTDTLDTDSKTQGTVSGPRAGLHGRVAVMKYVVTPLLQVIAEAHRAAKAEAPPTPEQESATLAALVEATLHLSEAATAAINDQREPMDESVRWGIISAATHIVAARFRATSQPMGEEEAQTLAKAVFETKDKFQSQSVNAGESVPNTLGSFRAKMLESLVPVVNAVAQYSFGRAEHLMLAQVSERILKTADQVTRGLAPPGCTPKDWRLLCWSVLQAAGFLYSDCHFAEADRLLYMEKDERDAYFGQHDNIPPLTFVWQAFDQRMAMLATLITYLDVPPTARLEEQDMA
ncbi:MAG TPA: hypothetical protein VHB73_06545 [Alphaproteobacteria bacterium]|nr:hypothetical protein [Alphaproteobacteria bacterium]